MESEKISRDTEVENKHNGYQVRKRGWDELGDWD